MRLIFLPSLAALFLLVLAAAPLPAPAHAPTPPSAPADGPAGAHARIAAAEARVARIGFRLATANADWCDRKAPQYGWMLGDRRLYSAGQWPAARATYRASDADAPFIAAIVPGSGADRAGLRVGDPLFMEPVVAPASPPHGRIDAWERWASSSGADTMIEVGTHGRQLSVAGTPGCLSDFRVEASSALNAGADGRVVKVPAALVELFRRDDVLAAAIAHELAHNILAHRARLDAAGVDPERKRLSARDKALIRRTEIDADALTVWLLAGAGFDPAAAITMLDQIGAAKGPQPFPSATHPSRKVRTALLRANIAAVTDARARDPSARPPIVDLKGPLAP
jgi:hypothetical protein